MNNTIFTFSFFIISLTAWAQVAPLIETEWNQSDILNQLYPVDKDNEKLPAGCAPIAWGQIMNYHQFPKTGVSTSGRLTGFGYVEAPFNTSMYSFSNSIQGTADQALFVFHTSVAANSDYSSEGTGSFSNEILRTAKKHFQYSTDAQVISKSYFSNNEWSELIKNELDNNRPVYYSGVDNKYGGHAFIIDGYAEDGTFHCNWGWGGKHNGYFQLDKLIIDTLDFSLKNRMIIGVKPKENYQSAPDFQFENKGGNTIAISNEKSNYHSEQVTNQEDIHVSFSIVNGGTITTADSTLVSVYINNTLKTSYNILIEELETNVTMSFSIGQISPGDFTISVVLDEDGDVAECNENNNQASASFTVTGEVPRPDLAITPIGTDTIVIYAIGSTNNYLLKDDNIASNFLVENIGKVATEDFFNIEITVNDIDKYSIPIQSTMPSSYKFEIEQFVLGVLGEGTHSLEINLDTENSVIEENELNNHYTKVFKVLNEIPIEIPKPVLNSPYKIICGTEYALPIHFRQSAELTYTFNIIPEHSASVSIENDSIYLLPSSGFIGNTSLEVIAQSGEYKSEPSSISFTVYDHPEIPNFYIEDSIVIIDQSEPLRSIVWSENITDFSKDSLPILHFSDEYMLTAINEQGCKSSAIINYTHYTDEPITYIDSDKGQSISINYKGKEQYILEGESISFDKIMISRSNGTFEVYRCADIDISHLPEGIYFITLLEQNQITFTETIFLD